MSELVDAPVDAELAGALAAATGRQIDQGPAPRRRYKRRGRATMWLAAAWLIFIVFSAVGASWLPYVKHSCSQYSNALECSTYDKGTPLKIERPPVWAVWAHSSTELPGAPARAGLMGTDRNGYDIFSRAVFGARISLTIGVLSITFGLLIGGTLGLLAGYRRGWVDRVTDNTMNIMLAFPALLLAIFVVTFLNSPDSTQQVTARKIWPIVLALALLSIPPLTRLVHANTLSYAQREFVLAARSIGAGDRRILFREILPNVVPSMMLVRLHRTGPADRRRGRPGLPRATGGGADAHVGQLIFAGKDQLQDAWWIALMPAWCCSSPSSASTCSATWWPSASTSGTRSSERRCARGLVRAAERPQSGTLLEVRGPPHLVHHAARHRAGRRRRDRSVSTGAAPWASSASPARARRSCPARSWACSRAQRRARAARSASRASELIDLTLKEMRAHLGRRRWR